MILTELLKRAPIDAGDPDTYLVTGDYGKIFKELKTWCDEQGIVLISFFDDSIRIYGKNGTPDKTIPFDPAEYAGTNKSLQLPHEVNEILLDRKCVFYYEDLLGMNQNVRDDYLNGLILAKPVMPYCSNVIAHIATKTKDQRIAIGKRIKYFFLSFCASDTDNIGDAPNSFLWDEDDMSRSIIEKYLKTGELDLFADEPDMDTMGSGVPPFLQYMTVSREVEQEWHNAPTGTFREALKKFMRDRQIPSQLALEDLFDVGHPTIISWLSERQPVCPKKEKLLHALIRANCTYDEAVELLSAAGYKFTEEKADTIIRFYFQNKSSQGWDERDLFETLRQYNCSTDFLNFD